MRGRRPTARRNRESVKLILRGFKIMQRRITKLEQRLDDLEKYGDRVLGIQLPPDHNKD